MRVAVYSYNAVSLAERVLYFVPPAQAIRMIADGEAVDVSRRCRHGKTQTHAIQLRTPECETRIDPATLSFADMRANVGEIGGNAKAGRILRAREKVAAWPTVGDTRAVRVGIRTQPAQ